MANTELKVRFIVELFTHLSDQEQDYIISVIISILSAK